MLGLAVRSVQHKVQVSPEGSKAGFSLHAGMPPARRVRECKQPNSELLILLALVKNNCLLSKKRCSVLEKKRLLLSINFH